jgi:hypothetical protein
MAMHFACQHISGRLYGNGSACQHITSMHLDGPRSGEEERLSAFKAT